MDCATLIWGLCSICHGEGKRQTIRLKKLSQRTTGLSNKRWWVEFYSDFVIEAQPGCRCVTTYLSVQEKERLPGAHFELFSQYKLWDNTQNITCQFEVEVLRSLKTHCAAVSSLQNSDVCKTNGRNSVLCRLTHMLTRWIQWTIKHTFADNMKGHASTHIKFRRIPACS